MKKISREFFFAAFLLIIATAVGAEAKGLGGPIRGMLMVRPIEVVVRAHVAPDADAAIIVDQSYFGPYKAGDRVPVNAPVFKKVVVVPGGGSQPELFLILTRAPGPGYEDWPYYFGKGLLIDEGLSRRISDGRVYFWYGSTEKFGFTFWRIFTNTASLTLDETHPDVAALEADLADGLARHDEWTRAQAATDPEVKLGLLRPFLLPGGEHHFTAYDVWSCSMGAFEEAEKAGPASVPFLNELLTEPSYQEEYAPQGWLGIGAQERAAVMKSLALVEARAVAKPQEKLARLRPVFDVPKYDFRAGFDPVGMVQQYFDRGLAVATSVDAADARPFLKGLLDLPQFQEGYSPIGQTSWGHDWRAKIQIALASLH